MFKPCKMSKLVAQVVRAPASDLCHAEQHRFKPLSAPDFLSVPMKYLVL